MVLVLYAEVRVAWRAVGGACDRAQGRGGLLVGRKEQRSAQRLDPVAGPTENGLYRIHVGKVLERPQQDVELEHRVGREDCVRGHATVLAMFAASATAFS